MHPSNTKQQQDEDAYFDGTVARDNEDATYLVEFDDGDVLDAAPRRDIRILPSLAPPAADTDTGQQGQHEVRRHRYSPNISRKGEDNIQGCCFN